MISIHTEHWDHLKKKNFKNETSHVEKKTILILIIVVIIIIIKLQLSYIHIIIIILHNNYFNY